METFEWPGFRIEYNPEADTRYEFAVEMYHADSEDGDISLRAWDDLEDARLDIGMDERFPMALEEWQQLWDWVDERTKET